MPFEVQARNRRLVIIALTVLGIFVAGYLTWSHFSGEPSTAADRQFLRSGEQQPLSLTWRHIPWRCSGLLAYLTILVLSLIPPTDDRQWPDVLLIFGVALIGVMSQWYLFYIEMVVLRAFCYWCITSQTHHHRDLHAVASIGAPGAAEEAEADLVVG